MSISLCPKCRALHECPEEQQREPCLTCWRAGWRTDSLGHLYQIQGGPSPAGG